MTALENSDLLNTLKARFEKNINRHKGIEWERVKERLGAHPEKLRSVQEMENTGGEPDVTGHDERTGEYIFCDCSPESPGGRRSICYDREGQEEREKEGIHPKGNAIDMAKDMGVEIMSEEQYRELQKLGKFDSKTSSWVKTPQEIRKLGGALFCDRRYETVFLYHNGAQSFYAARGFRGLVKV